MLAFFKKYAIIRELNVREWLSGRALPCQGKGREFESRLPLQKKDLLKKRFFYVFGYFKKIFLKTIQNLLTLFQNCAILIM